MKIEYFRSHSQALSSTLIAIECLNSNAQKAKGQIHDKNHFIVDPFDWYWQDSFTSLKYANC